MLNKTITVIDYGLGNLYSVARAIEHLNNKARIINEPAELKNASYVILPGVGAFSKGIDNLVRQGWVDEIKKYIEMYRPFLGICLGMQLLFSNSEEGRGDQGLNILSGRVVKIPPPQIEKKYKIPHIGWNSLILQEKNYSLDKDLMELQGASMYFAHSYHILTQEENIVYSCQYFENSIAALVQKDNIMGCQFHPEKSGVHGLKFLKKFTKIN